MNFITTSFEQMYSNLLKELYVMNSYTPTPTTAALMIVPPVRKGADLPRSNQQTGQITPTVMGVFVLLLFASYIGIGCWYKKHRKQQLATRIQRILALEKNWQLTAYIKDRKP